MLSKKNYEELMKIMDKKIPRSRDYVNSVSNVMARGILKRRLELGLTQSELANLVKDVTGKTMHQSTISEVEGGTAILTTETYDRVLKTLGMTIEFTDESEARLSSLDFVPYSRQFNELEERA